MINILPPTIENEITQAVIFDYDELWLPMNYEIHPNIRRIYYVSNHGRVFSISHNRFLTQEKSNTGYYRVNLIKIDDVNHPQHYAVHRLVLETFNPIENMENLFVNHIDANKTNNILTNLEWTTASENSQHAIRNSLINWQTGDKCSWSTISEDEADIIGYYLSTNNYTYGEIADIVNCSKSVICNIANGISWRHIYKKYELWKRKTRIKSHFDKDQYDTITQYIINNINNYNVTDCYRCLCMDACKSVNIVMNRDQYIELLDFIYININKNNS